MIKSFSLFWQNFAVFKGRTRRRNFWLTILSQLIIAAIFVILAKFLGIFKYVGEIYALVCLIPSLAMCVRRMHDTGKSGKRLFLILIPIVGLIILFVNFVSDSQKVTNEYGASEKYPDENAELPTLEENDEPAPIDIPPIYAEQPRTEFNPVSFTPPVQAPTAVTGNVYSCAAQEPVAPAAPVVQAPPVATPVQTPVQQSADSMYSQGRPSYTAASQPTAAPAQPTPQQNGTPSSQPVQPQGYRTRGFPYGH